MSSTMPAPDRSPEDLALAAGEAAAEVLPASEALVAGGVQPGTEQVASLFAAGIVADLGGGAAGPLALLVADELQAVIAQSPLPGLDLAAAVQPALDAAAAALGGSVGVAREVAPTELLGLFSGAYTVVPLIGGSISAALVVADSTLAGRPAPAPAAFQAAPDDSPLAAAIPVPAPEPGSAPALASVSTPARGLEMLHGVDMEVTVELGRARMSVRDLLALTPGNVLELDRAAGSPADLLVNGRLIARGEVVVVDEDFGLRVTEILDESAAV